MVAHERLSEPRVTKESLLAKPRSILNLPVFLFLMVGFFTLSPDLLFPLFFGI